MESKYNLTRFLDAQNQVYLNALDEIRRGRKQSHWMWFVFPQLKGLGHSTTSEFYGITDLDEAESYLAHPVLGKHLVEISGQLLKIEGKTASEIFGSPDDMKLRSSMTLFSTAGNTHPVFKQVLEKYFSGIPDELTMKLLNKL